MPRFRPDSCIIEWIHAGGTALLAGQYRKLSLRHAADPIEITGGAVADREYSAGPAYFSIRLEGFHNGNASGLGTADLAALAPRSNGTVRVSPLGTASGQMRYVGAALVTARDLTFEFGELATVSIEWRGSGPLTQGKW